MRMSSISPDLKYLDTILNAATTYTDEEEYLDVKAKATEEKVALKNKLKREHRLANIG
jgi:hypothetical protein